jgi:hypothetical protein
MIDLALPPPNHCVLVLPQLLNEPIPSNHARSPSVATRKRGID